MIFPRLGILKSGEETTKQDTEQSLLLISMESWLPIVEHLQFDTA